MERSLLRFSKTEAAAVCEEKGQECTSQVTLATPFPSPGPWLLYSKVKVDSAVDF